jgi:nucleotide-binding universal stress UspA family protein
MKTILFPTDFSTNANRALEYAVEIASLTNATLHILHVYTPVVSKDNAFSSLLGDEVADATHEAREKLRVMTDMISKEYPRVKCQARVRVGEPVDEILKVSKEIGSDLIIMGTLGASKLSKMIFGSNTSAVIE